jgi:hypothetical protein
MPKFHEPVVGPLEIWPEWCTTYPSSPEATPKKPGDPKPVGATEVSESDEGEWCTTYPSAS